MLASFFAQWMENVHKAQSYHQSSRETVAIAAISLYYLSQAESASENVWFLLNQTGPRINDVTVLLERLVTGNIHAAASCLLQFINRCMIYVGLP